jgi:hypothetical protein
MQPSDFPAPFGRDFGSPCQRLTSMQKLVLSRLHVLLRTRSALEMGHRHSVRPGFFEERRGPPRLLGHPLHTCRGATPRRNQPLLAHPRRGRHRLHAITNARQPELALFRGHPPTAHMLACLRIADPVTEAVARLTTGSGGLAPGRAGFAPAGQQTTFHGVIAALQFQLTSRAWSHAIATPRNPGLPYICNRPGSPVSQIISRMRWS